MIQTPRRKNKSLQEYFQSPIVEPELPDLVSDICPSWQEQIAIEIAKLQAESPAKQAMSPDVHQESAAKEDQSSKVAPPIQTRWNKGGRPKGRTRGKQAGFNTNKRPLGGPVLRRDPTAQAMDQEKFLNIELNIHCI